MSVAGLLIACASHADAQTVLINPPTRNGSFELLGGVAGSTDKAAHWDKPAGDVDSWTLWSSQTTHPNGSGTDDSGAATDGACTAFLQEENAAYNRTDHVVEVGDVFTYA